MAPVLALLQDIPAVVSAEVDRSGTVLRLRLASRARLEGALALLREGGYEAVVLVGPEAEAAERSVSDWYDRARSRELSRAEAQVLAGEIAAELAAARALPAPREARARSVVRERLDEALIGEAVPDALRERVRACVGRVLDDLRAELDEASLAALESILQAKLGAKTDR